MVHELIVHSSTTRCVECSPWLIVYKDVERSAVSGSIAMTTHPDSPPLTPYTQTALPLNGILACAPVSVENEMDSLRY